MVVRYDKSGDKILEYKNKSLWNEIFNNKQNEIAINIRYLGNGKSGVLNKRQTRMLDGLIINEKQPSSKKLNNNYKIQSEDGME
jgi:hypothetical protein